MKNILPYAIAAIVAIAVHVLLGTDASLPGVSRSAEPAAAPVEAVAAPVQPVEAVEDVEATDAPDTAETPVEGSTETPTDESGDTACSCAEDVAHLNRIVDFHSQLLGHLLTPVAERDDLGLPPEPESGTVEDDDEVWPSGW